MAVKKSELYNSLWRSCDELRGGMDASLYKNYILTLLFVKYVTDRFKGDPDAQIEIPEAGGSFDDLVAAKHKTDIGDRINKVIRKLADENGLVGIIDQADFDDDNMLGSGNDKVEKLTNLIAIFEDKKLDFRKNRAGGDDIIGDAYEYLMREFAKDSGKSKGQFYTPAEVSRILAKIIGIDKTTRASNTVYDPACGSGSLLIRAADEAPNGITPYGQEFDPVTAGLAKMNLVLHNKSTGTIANGNTLSNPKFKTDEVPDRFDFAVANPPFSYKSWSNGVTTNSIRFQDYDTLPPEKNGDYAWLMHFIYSLKPQKGKGAIILPHGVLFRGNAEATIRTKIISRKIIKGIIGLPANLFFGTPIPACIIVIDKENTKSRKGIFMIDASKGFIKDGNKNRLREQDIRKIIDCFNEHIEIDGYSRLVPYSEIEKKNECNLNISRYIDSSNKEDAQDIEAHLKGGLPNKDIDELSKYWSAFPSLRNELFSDFGRKGYCKLNVPREDIRKVVFGNTEFENYARGVAAEFVKWKQNHYAEFTGIKKGTNPKTFIDPIATDILVQFSQLELLDKYDVYQQLLEYWEETMQDDVYAVAYDGWEAGSETVKEYVTKKDKKGNTVTTDKIKAWEGRMIPKLLMIDVYFPDEHDAIKRLETELLEVQQQMEELREEHGGEEDLLAEVIDKGKITSKKLKERIKEIKKNADDAEELQMLLKYEKLMGNESTYNTAIKNAKEALDKVVFAKYSELTIEEIKELVIDKKWCNTLFDCVDTLFSTISHQLAARIIELSERYADTLPELEKHVSDLEKKVKSHLERMGYKW
ncbi:type I restriction-modification system subunit M [Anaerotignum sp.]|uniref:type I restriction-modification system subunit M n=1 Tax=Anaerotignum sp. TaxID=2039241 RepID=UPI0028AA437F|nr:type I restriction-modification system subunit M [Anaerotignum sp.]